MRTAKLLAAASLLTFAVGCGSAGDEATADGLPAPPPSAAGETGSAAAKAVKLSGTYELSSRFDLTTAGILPDMANDTLRALSGLKDNPAGTIMDLLVVAKVPIISTVLAWLPGALKTPFQGWFNDHVIKSIYQGAPAAEQLASITDDLASIVTRFEVVSTLDLADTDAYGNANAKHQFKGVAFTLANQRTMIDAPDLVAKVATADAVACNAVHIVESSPTIEDGRLELGDHFFGLPLGQYALRGIDHVAQTKMNVPNLRAALGAIVKCDEVAKDVASKCIGTLCVGHESDVKAMCEAGLDAVVEETTKKLSTLDFKAMHFVAGEAKMWDAQEAGGAKDGRADRIDHGEWTASLNVGKGEHATSATFTGRRTN